MVTDTDQSERSDTIKVKGEHEKGHWRPKSGAVDKHAPLLLLVYTVPVGILPKRISVEAPGVCRAQTK